MLIDVYETVYKIRSSLLALKNSPKMSQVQAASKQVTLPRINHVTIKRTVHDLDLPNVAAILSYGEIDLQFVVLYIFYDAWLDFISIKK